MIIECSKCSAIVDANELAVYEDGGEHDNHGNMIDVPGRWSLVSCPSCRMPMLTVQCDYGRGFGEDSPARVYPPYERQLGWKVPDTIKKAFNEAVVCFRARAFTASAIMCRKTLEGLCAEHGVKGVNLSQSLKKLREKQVIEEKLFQWAEALRTLGNEAAHGVECTISREDCIDTLDFTEALVQYVFTYQDQFQEFIKRRENAAVSSVLISKGST